MLSALLAVASLQSGSNPRPSPVDNAVHVGNFGIAWSEKGVSVEIGGQVRWRTDEVLAYRPDYLSAYKAFLLVTDATGGKYHVTVVDRALHVRCQLEINGAAAGVPGVVPCADMVCFTDPGLFARAPILGEKNPSWLDARQQLNVLNYSIVNGSLKWQKPELAVGQPLSSSGLFLWTVRLTNAAAAYAGLKPEYEIDQVGCHTGKVARSWTYPASGLDLSCYRWRAEIRGSACFLHRMEAWPDVSIDGNTSPKEISLAKIIQPVKLKRRLTRKK